MRDIDRVLTALGSEWLLVRRARLQDGDAGEWYGTILLDTSLPNDDEGLEILVHETVHAVYPLALESEVRRRTRAVLKNLTPRQKNRLRKFLASVR